jgi:hypothetical protein
VAFFGFFSFLLFFAHQVVVAAVRFREEEDGIIYGMTE